MKELFRKVGDINYEGLITDSNPAVQVRGGTIAALAAPTTYKGGTVFSKSAAEKKLYILGTVAEEGDTLTPDCILCIDTEISTEDVTATVYTAGCFDPQKVIVSEGYTITEDDKDKLRKRGIVFKAASAAN